MLVGDCIYAGNLTINILIKALWVRRVEGVMETKYELFIEIV